ncbi:Cation-dependent mannose-6-phosphate receptor [Bulinus truncatus]|nr:Cation-dependent mannose-6-phosphate receptor [Bulinus truncatus]
MGFRCLHSVIILSVFLQHSLAVKKCEYNKASCSCETEEGVIDLKPLSKSEPLSVEYKQKNEMYYWDPCKDFTMGTITSGSIQVQIPALYYDIGSHDNAGTALDDKGQPMFYMAAKDGYRTTFVTCICASDTSFSFLKEEPQTNYLFELKSEYCCPGYQGGGDGSSLSVGSILTILFFSLLVCYLALGTVFQISIRKAGGRDRLPNYNFWSAMPGLIKDGFLFTFSKCRKSSQYSNI